MKPKVKKVLKIVAPAMAIGLTISGVIVLSSGIIHNVTTVSIGGSTAVLPLINDISKYFNYIDIVTSAGGSGVGINSIINGSKEIGMASKNPQIEKWKENQLDEYKYNAWKDKKVKTLTIAWDGIGIIYKPTKKSMNEDLNIDSKTLGKIYSAFSGYKNITFNDLFNNGDEKIITPYARNGGGDVSGTTEAFLLESNVVWDQDISEVEKNIIVNNIQKGDYGSHVRQTSEANSQAWANVKNGPEGSMIYLSSGFIINNKKEIEKYGFKIAKYNGQEMIIENIANGYNWFRPFNLIYSMDHVRHKPSIIQMFEDIIFDPNNKIHEIMKTNGFKPLSNIQRESLFNPNIDIDNVQDKKSLFIDVINTDIELTYSGAKPKIKQVWNDTRI